MNIKTFYHNNVQFLNKDEWTNLIKYYLNLIQSTEIGGILLKYINRHIENGFEVIIQNYAPDKNFQYPFCKKNDNHIYINFPDTPYFIKVPVLNLELIKGFIPAKNIKNIKKCKPVNNILDTNLIHTFTTYKFQPMVVILFHELIHCLRYMFNYNSDTEEESTIYGITNDTLNLENRFITENSFRKELKLEPRMSHQSEYYYVHNTNNSINISKETLKKNFKKIKLMI